MKSFADELQNLNIYDKINKNINCCPQDNYEIFASLVKLANEKHLPSKIVKYNKRKHMKSKWMTDGILKSINTKGKLYKILIQTDIEDEHLYTRLKSELITHRTVLRRNIRESKRMYHTRTFELYIYKKIFKKTCFVINSTFSRKKKCNESEQFIIGDKELKDPTVIANEFNKYFVNIGQSLAEKITPTHDFNFYLKNRIDSQLRFTLVDEEHIVWIFNRLKNKSGYGCDNISNKLLKYAKTFLIKPLTLLINQTLSTGIFPNELKISRVRPLFKNGDTSNINNYRPISILPSISTNL